jgi:hypothetical protein
MKMNGINSRKAFGQSGASLLEGLIYIVFVAIIIAGVVAASVKVFGNQKEGRTNEQIVETATGIKTVWAGHSNYGTAGTNMIPSLAAAGVLPADLATSGGPPATDATNLYGGDFDVVVGNPTNTYVITLDGLDDDVCLRLSGKSQPGWVSVSINGGTPITTFPLPVATATAQCTAGAASNSIAWVGR